MQKTDGKLSQIGGNMFRVKQQTRKRTRTTGSNRTQARRTNVRTVPHYRRGETKSGWRSRGRWGGGRDELYGSCDRSSGHNRPHHGYCQQQLRLGDINLFRQWRCYYLRGVTQRAQLHLTHIPVDMARLVAAFPPPTTYLVTRVPPATTETVRPTSLDMSRGVLASPAAFIVVQLCPCGTAHLPIPATASSPAAGQRRWWTASLGRLRTGGHETNEPTDILRRDTR